MFILRQRSLSYSNFIRWNYGIHNTHILAWACQDSKQNEVRLYVPGLYYQDITGIESCCLRLPQHICLYLFENFKFVLFLGDNYHETLFCSLVISFRHIKVKNVNKKSVNITLVAHLFPLNSDNFILYNIIHKKRDNQT